jgi:hypothetical protein
MRERLRRAGLAFWLLGSVALVLLTLGGNQHVDAQGGSYEYWSCSLDDIGATLTECIASVTSRPLSTLTQEKLIVTDIVAQSTTTTGGLALIRYGTAANCGTGTTSLIPSAATVPRLFYGASTGAPLVIHLDPGLVVPAALFQAAHPRLCVIGTAVNTVSIQISGKLVF